MVMVFEFTSQHPNFPKPNPSFSHNHKFCLVYDLSGSLPTHTPPLPTSTEVPVPHEFQGLGPKDLGPRGVAVAGHVDEIQTHLAVAVPGWDATRLGVVGGWGGLGKPGKDLLWDIIIVLIKFPNAAMAPSRLFGLPRHWRHFGHGAELRDAVQQGGPHPAALEDLATHHPFIREIGYLHVHSCFCVIMVHPIPIFNRSWT